MLRSQLSLHKALGAEYLAAFQPEKASRCYTAALALLGQMEHARLEEAAIFFGLGSARLTARRFAEALDAYTQSQRILEEEGDNRNIGVTWHQIGRVYAAQEDFSGAARSYRQALELCLQTEMRQHCAVVLASLRRLLPVLSEQKRQAFLGELSAAARRVLTAAAD